MYSAHVSRWNMLCLKSVMTVTAAFMTNLLIDHLSWSPRCQTSHQHGHHPATGQSRTTHSWLWLLDVPGDVVKVTWMCSLKTFVYFFQKWIVSPIAELQMFLGRTWPESGKNASHVSSQGKEQVKEPSITTSKQSSPLCSAHEWDSFCPPNKWVLCRRWLHRFSRRYF